MLLENISFFPRVCQQREIQRDGVFMFQLLTSAAWQPNYALSKEIPINIGKDFLFTFLLLLFISVFILLATQYLWMIWSSSVFHIELVRIQPEAILAVRSMWYVLHSQRLLALLRLAMVFCIAVAFPMPCCSYAAGITSILKEYFRNLF